jgi:hypothetical protein
LTAKDGACEIPPDHPADFGVYCPRSRKNCLPLLMGTITWKFPLTAWTGALTGDQFGALRVLVLSAR